jgi:hypothetical protein
LFRGLKGANRWFSLCRPDQFYSTGSKPPFPIPILLLGTPIVHKLKPIFILDGGRATGHDFFLGQDAESRSTPNGTAYTRLSLATT